MDNPDVSVALSCGKCGSNNLAIPNNPDKSFVVKCQSCGTVIGTWGDIESAAAKHVAEGVNKELKSELRKAFEGDENISIE